MDLTGMIRATCAAALLGTAPLWLAGQFVDASAGSGLDFQLVSGEPEKPYIIESMTGGVGFVDYDEDGWIDIYLVKRKHSRSHCP